MDDTTLDSKSNILSDFSVYTFYFLQFQFSWVKETRWSKGKKVILKEYRVPMKPKEWGLKKMVVNHRIKC